MYLVRVQYGRNQPFIHPPHHTSPLSIRVDGLVLFGLVRFSSVSVRFRSHSFISFSFQRIDVSLSFQWIDGWMDCMDGWIVCMDRWMVCMDGWMVCNGQTDKWIININIKLWTYGTDRWINNTNNIWTDRQKDQQHIGQDRQDRQTDRQTQKPIHPSIHKQAFNSLFLFSLFQNAKCKINRLALLLYLLYYFTLLPFFLSLFLSFFLSFLSFFLSSLSFLPCKHHYYYPVDFTLSYFTSPYLILPYLTFPYLNLSYLTLLYLTLLYIIQFTLFD